MEWKRIAVAGMGAVIAAGVGTSYVKEHYDQIDRQYESLRLEYRRAAYVLLEKRKNQKPEPFNCYAFGCTM